MERLTGKETLNLLNRTVIFIGPEGSGKTTIAKQLAQESGRPYITTGDILRDLADNDDGPLGEDCRQMFNESRYLSGEKLLEILANRFSQEDTSHGWILDGGLRTLEETVGFQDMLGSAGRPFSVTVVHLQIPREMSMERLVTGDNARKRDRDTEEGVNSRLDKFYDQLDERVAQILEHGYEIIEIDATQPVEVVYSAVKESL